MKLFPENRDVMLSDGRNGLSAEAMQSERAVLTTNPGKAVD